MSDLPRAGASPSSPRQACGWLAPSAHHLRSFLALPELAVVAESCAAERRLHEELLADPHRRVEPGSLAAVADDDARSSYETFVRFRDALLAAGTFEAYYLALMRSGRIVVPPVFIANVVEAIIAHVFEGCSDAFERRAAQLLHRRQRVTISNGRVLSADADATERRSDASGDIIGRLLRQGGDDDGASMPVLGADNAGVFAAQGDPPSFILDLTHESTSELGHGLRFITRRADSGLAALARVLERWIAHFLGVRTTIRPLQRIDDPAWSWHIGLDIEASALLDDLYRGLAPDAGRLQRLIGLFRLDFFDPAEMRANLAGKPVYLGVAMTEAQTLKLKPQNLLINLPLAAAM
jgi:hypothetical protein